MTTAFVVLSLLVISYAGGRATEQGHYRSLRRREEMMQSQPFLAEPIVEFAKPVRHVTVAVSQVVIAGDFFRHFWASLRHLFGGHITAYESLKDRAQREAVLRIKEAYPKADYFINAKVAAVDRQWIMAKVVVCATVIHLEP